MITHIKVLCGFIKSYFSWQLHKKYKTYSKTYKKTYREIIWKSFWAYLKDCVILRKGIYKIKYTSDYNVGFPKRMKDWVEYFGKCVFWCCVYFMRCLAFWDKFGRRYAKERFIRQKLSTPFHHKQLLYVNEGLLYEFLEQHGFMVVEEELEYRSSTYFVKRKND